MRPFEAGIRDQKSIPFLKDRSGPRLGTWGKPGKGPQETEDNPLSFLAFPA
jgi:hypothetical protein